MATFLILLSSGLAFYLLLDVLLLSGRWMENERFIRVALPISAIMIVLIVLYHAVWFKVLSDSRKKKELSIRSDPFPAKKQNILTLKRLERIMFVTPFINERDERGQPHAKRR